MSIILCDCLCENPPCQRTLHSSMQMKFYLCYLAKDRTQTQNIDITINFHCSIVFIDDQHPTLGNISVYDY